MKKIETLNKAIEVESRKMKKEAAIREKDSATATKTDDNARSGNSLTRSAFPLFFFTLSMLRSNHSSKYVTSFCSAAPSGSKHFEEDTFIGRKRSIRFLCSSV